MKPTLLLFLLAIGASGQQAKPLIKVQLAMGDYGWGCPIGYALHYHDPRMPHFIDSDGTDWTSDKDSAECREKPAAPHVRKHRRKHVAPVVPCGYYTPRVVSDAEVTIISREVRKNCAPKPQEVKKP